MFGYLTWHSLVITYALVWDKSLAETFVWSYMLLSWSWISLWLEIMQKYMWRMLCKGESQSWISVRGCWRASLCFFYLCVHTYLPSKHHLICLYCGLFYCFLIKSQFMHLQSFQPFLFSLTMIGESCSVEKELETSIATKAVYQDKTNILFSVKLIFLD